MKQKYANNMDFYLDKWLDVLNYWFEHVEDYGDRYPDMADMVEAFDETIEEMYNAYKEIKGQKDGKQD